MPPPELRSLIETKFIGINMIKYIRTHKFTTTDCALKIGTNICEIVENPTIDRPVAIRDAPKLQTKNHLKIKKLKIPSGVKLKYLRFRELRR